MLQSFGRSTLGYVILNYRVPLNPASTSVTVRFGLCAGPLDCLFDYDDVDDVSVSKLGAFTL